MSDLVDALEGWGANHHCCDESAVVGEAAHNWAEFIDDPIAAIRAGVESGTIKGMELNLCHVHGSVMTGAVFYEGTRVCQYAWYSGHAVEACFGYRGVVIPITDGEGKT